MSKAIVNKISMILYFIVGAVLLELTAFNILGMGVLPTNFWYDMAIILVLGVLIFAIPNYTIEFIVSTIILLVQVVLIYTNYTLYTIYGDMFSFEMLLLIKEAGEAMSSSFIYYKVILQLIAIFIGIIIVGLILLKNCRKHKIKIKQHFSIFAIIIILGLQCFSIPFLVGYRSNVDTISNINSRDYVFSDSFLLNSSFMKASSYRRFGSYGYFFNMLINNFKSVDDLVVESTINYFNNGSIYSSSDVFGVDYDSIEDKRNNVIVIMMESTEWFTFGDGTYDKDKNNFSPEITPYIYSLIYGDDYITDTNNNNKSNDSLVARNFFSKNKTNLSEGLSFIGNYPVVENLLNLTKGSIPDRFGYSLPNILSNLGYNTNYVHSNTSTFYDRDETHPYIGFDNVIGRDNLLDEEGNHLYQSDELKFGNWSNEEEFVKNAMRYIIPADYAENPFYTFYLNVSSHGAYDYNENDSDCVRYYYLIKYGEDDCLLDENNNYVLDPNKSDDELTYSSWYQNILNAYYDNDPNLCEELLVYECGIKALDSAIGIMIQQLKDYNIYDKTTILLFSDHNSYYDNLSNRVKGIDIGDTTRYTELYSVPMILSSPGLKKYNASHGNVFINNDRFCSAYDIIPTLFDLLGIEFNENFYLGHSLFKPLDYSYENTSTGKMVDMVVFYSNTGGLFSKDIYSYDLSNFVLENADVNKDELISKFKAEATNILIKINYITLLNKCGLYNRITVK